MTDTSSPTITTMTEADAISRLQGHDVGRLSIDVDGYPIALPVNYVVDLRPRSDDRIIIRAAPGSVIGCHAGPASLEVDHIDLRDGEAWSVLVRGDFGRVRGRRPAVGPDPFVADGRTRWMQLRIRDVDGRRFTGDIGGLGAGRTHADEANETSREQSPPWLDRIVAAAAGTVRDQFERFHAVVASPESTE